MDPTATPNEPNAEKRAREAYWRARLGRIRLGAEPIPVQLERYRRVTVVFSAVAGGVALMFLALFSAFRQPLVGLALALLLMGPLVAIIWLDFATLRSRVLAYLQEVEGAPVTEET